MTQFGWVFWSDEFFLILEYIWVFVILASAGRAIVVFSTVTNRARDFWEKKAALMQRKESCISAGRQQTVY